MATRHDWLRNLGRQIRAARTTLGLTQEQLGKRAGIVGKYVSEIERGTRDPRLSTLLAIVEGLGRALEVEFRKKNGSRPNLRLPSSADTLGEVLDSLHHERRAKLLVVIEALVELAR